MKLSELIKELQVAQHEYGDVEVKFYASGVGYKGAMLNAKVDHTEMVVDSVELDLE